MNPIQVGQTVSETRRITPDDVRRFAELSGDHNPVHLDEEFARASRFGRPIAHGIFSAALISSLLATKLPGPGTVYLSQSLRFRLPVYIGDDITTTVVVTAVRDDKPIVTLQTYCDNQDGQRVVEGEAVVLRT